MNHRLTQILIGSLVISGLVASIPFIEFEFHVFSKFRNYAIGYGSKLFTCLLVITVASITFTVCCYRAKRSVLAATTMFVALSGIVAMCLPSQARAVQNYFSHEGSQSRLVERFNAELLLDERFQDIKLEYWHGKGEGCSIYGSVQSNEDLAALEAIVSAKTRLFVNSKVEIGAQRD